jgi:hypothetical protein
MTCGPGRRPVRIFIRDNWLVLLFAWAVLAFVTAAQSEDLRTGHDGQVHRIAGQNGNGGPSPDLTPEHVVRIQLAALRDVDPTGRGIARCFEFASPQNREHIGSLERFGKMLAMPPYSVMLGHKKALVGKAQLRGNHAQVIATVLDTDDRLHVFSFVLSKQSSAPFLDCWMTGAVVAVPVDRGQGQ